MNILLIRHGETDGNLKGFVQNANTPLNASGKNQATLLHKALNNGIFQKYCPAISLELNKPLKSLPKRRIFLAFGQQPYAREILGIKGDVL